MLKYIICTIFEITYIVFTGNLENVWIKSLFQILDKNQSFYFKRE